MAGEIRRRGPLPLFPYLLSPIPSGPGRSAPFWVQEPGFSERLGEALRPSICLDEEFSLDDSVFSQVASRG